MTGFDSKRQAALDKLFEVENELGLHYDQRTPMTKDEAWEMIDSALDHCYSETDVTAIKEALAQPEQGLDEAAIRADEREACAKLVEPDEEHRRDASWGYLGGEEGVELLDGKAKAIRARGEQ
jgi:hypothetical protein